MSELAQANEALPIVFNWTKAGVIAAVSPAPTYSVVDGSGAVVDSGTLTAQATVDYPYTLQEAAGYYRVFATTTDTAVDVSTFVEYVRVGQSWIEAIDDIETLLIGLNASATITSPVREVGGEYEIAVKQGETMSTATGNAIALTFTGVPDTTGGACVLTFTDMDGEIIAEITGNPFTGVLGTWAAGSVVATWQLTAAQTALFPASQSNRTDLQRTIRFEAKITLSAGVVVLKPVVATVGNVRVYAAPYA